MKLYRLDIKNRLNAPHKNENLRKKRVMAQVSETVSEEDRKRHLQSEYEEIVGEYDKGKYPSYENFENDCFSYRTTQSI